MRGEHDSLRLSVVGQAGVIPACAGSTRSCEAPARPREGSSPHARGAQSQTAAASADARGHPSMRGEHSSRRRGARPRRGSSPHARGAPSKLKQRGVSTGVIPACAGSTLPSSTLPTFMPGSSPHARGAPLSSAADVETYRGHPRMRGEHRAYVIYGRIGVGVIPACAGSTLASGTSLQQWAGSSPHARGARPRSRNRGARWRDHPRMRGEHARRAERDSRVAGSSPHARGAPRGLKTS